MNKLIARAKSVIKLTGRSGELCDISISKGGNIIDGLNSFLPLLGVTGKVFISQDKGNNSLDPNDLKPCPFCGGAAVSENGEVWCGECYSQSPIGISFVEAVKLWNTRK
ncbi:Lar family restriction alleviation protein [Shewanella frigidimarina]|uniref:Lar family restriction alleviation protein n=1 Tax=Shewanella frigidimarina TaxID=56812 RepID=UPI003D78B79C